MINLITWVFQPPTNQSTFIEMLTYFNSLTDVGHGGMFFSVMLIVLGGVLFMMMRAYSPERAMGITFIILAILAFLFKLLSWIPSSVMTICIILGIFGVFLLVKSGEAFD